MDYDRHDALLHWLFKHTQGADAWFRPDDEGSISSAVALRISPLDAPPPAEYRVFPYENSSLLPFEEAVRALGPVVAVKVRSAAVHAALAAVHPEDPSVYVDTNTRIQILDSILALPAADKEQCAAFIRDERVLIVWSDAIDRIVPICSDFEDRLIKLLWRDHPLSSSSSSSSHAPSRPPSSSGHREHREPLISRPSYSRAGPASIADGSTHSGLDLDTPTTDRTTPPKKNLTNKPRFPTPLSNQTKPVPPVPRRVWFPWFPLRRNPDVKTNSDEESGTDEEKSNQHTTTSQDDDTDRPHHFPRRDDRKSALWAPLYNGLAAAIALIFIGNGINILFQEWTLDGQAIRFALLAVCPMLYCVALFFALQIIQNVTMVIGPIEQYHSNSKYYSAIKPREPIKETLGGLEERLPHITIQMPVYKESLSAVLAPSILSLKRAMQTYARQGGTSAIFVNDDGLRVLPEQAQRERLTFYAVHGIGWVARPPGGVEVASTVPPSVENSISGPSSGSGSTSQEEVQVQSVSVVDEDDSEESVIHIRTRRSRVRDTDVEKGFEMRERGTENGKERKAEVVEVVNDRESGGYVRAGRFKKASNMNYGLELSLRVEKHLARLMLHQKKTPPQREQQQGGGESSTAAPGEASDGRFPTAMPTSVAENTLPPPSRPNLAFLGAPWLGFGVYAPTHEQPASNASGTNTHVQPPSVEVQSQAQAQAPTKSKGQKSQAFQVSLEDQALALALEEAWEENGRRHRPWAAHGRAARMGEIVLLVDADTVVPEDCLRDAAREMKECPQVAIIQHESDVMQVVRHYFENGIAYFTRRINKSISMSCANGEVAPFVGHNAFLRWRALQDAAFIDPADGKEKVWSESNVSEDFDMALRLMAKGYIIRWATYSQGGFKEGVSLSVDDEVNRWQKYSFGCSELLFNPFKRWLRHGPIAGQIHRFMWSSAPLHYKISMMAYMFSYYGIAASVTLCIINYVLLGFQFGVDGFYMHSFELWLATATVFFGSGTVGYSVLQYRLGQKQLVPAFLENIMWIPFYFFFFGGLSIPVSQAILAHMFSYNISWSATVKEVHRSNFFKEIPKIAKRFWFSMTLSLILILVVTLLSTHLVPLEWRVDAVDAWGVIFPVVLLAGCHILFPIVLNPWLMVFSY